MIFRSILAVISGVLIASSPVAAKSKEPVAAPAPALPTVVDPDPAHVPEDVLWLDLSNGGRVAIRLMPAWAPNHVERIKTLTGQGFYNGVVFHRVIEGFMAQTGDPTGTGAGGSQLPDLKAEFSDAKFLRGTVGIAREPHNINSGNSQFFICFSAAEWLNGEYTIVGEIVDGMEFVDKIARGEPPANPDRIVKMQVAADAAK